MDPEHRTLGTPGQPYSMRTKQQARPHDPESRGRIGKQEQQSHAHASDVTASMQTTKQHPKASSIHGPTFRAFQHPSIPRPRPLLLGAFGVLNPCPAIRHYQVLSNQSHNC